MYHLTLVSLVVLSVVEVAEEDNDEDNAHDDADNDDDPELQLRQPSCQHRFCRRKKKNDFLVDLFFKNKPMTLRSERGNN